MLFPTAEVKSHLFSTCLFVTVLGLWRKKLVIVVLMAISGEDMSISLNDAVGSSYIQMEA